MTPAEAQTYLQIAVMRPSRSKEFAEVAAKELVRIIPAVVTTVGSYFLSDWLARRLGRPEGLRPAPHDFAESIRSAPIAPAKIATAGGGERPEPPENLLSFRRMVFDAAAKAAEGERRAKEALLEALRNKGINV